VKSWLESMQVFIENGLVRLKDLVAETITSKNIIVQKLCVEDVCVDKAGLQALLLNAGISPISQISPTDQDADATSTPSIDNSAQSASSSPQESADVEPPVITLNGPATIEIEKGTAWVDPGATVSDNVNENLGIHYTVDGVLTGSEGNQLPHEVINTDVAGSHTIIYSSTDQAGNIGTASRTLNVIDPAPAE